MKVVILRSKRKKMDMEPSLTTGAEQASTTTSILFVAKSPTVGPLAGRSLGTPLDSFNAAIKPAHNSIRTTFHCNLNSRPYLKVSSDYSCHQLTFWLYFIFQVLLATFSNICFTLVDASAVALCGIHDAEYGRQRL